ncbi:hypothetical protein MXB_2588, partial [Myxobolus squamalis]
MSKIVVEIEFSKSDSFYFPQAEHPYVVRDILKKSSLKEMSIENLASLKGTELVNFKIGFKRKYHDERDCLYLDGTLKDLINWSQGKHPSSFESLNSDEFWVYADYKNFCELFPKNAYPEIHEQNDWSFVGYPDKRMDDTTIWIGTSGAYTPLHFDSYGINFHTVISGSKDWTLFSPEDSKYLYPKRIPYEESSIYSSVQIFNPELHCHPLFEKTTPYKVTVNAGDVLYIPRHWWHLVVCAETTLSLNVWCDTEWLNPNEVSEITYNQ